MSYRIEYLTEPSDEDSVVQAIDATGADLAAVEREALKHAEPAKQRGATGYQIRHVNAVDRVIAIATFDDGELIADLRHEN